MNLFLIGWSPSARVDLLAGKRAVAELVASVPFFEAEDVRTWASPSGHAAVACVVHSGAAVGGIEYARFDENRMALFAGRPFIWVDESEANGRAPLDPRFYFAPPETWMHRLAGRSAAARYDDDTRVLEVYTDPLGSYPVYSTDAEGVLWLSNSAAVLSALRGARRNLRTTALASFLACGWGLGGEPLWEGVNRLPRGTIQRFRPVAPPERVELLPLDEIHAFFDGEFDARGASALLVSATRALADWPGRPSAVPLTGGRDSRLVFAAALRASVDFETRTVAFTHADGFPETADVRVARMLCEQAGRGHVVRPSQTRMDLRRAAEVLRLVSPGTVSLGDTLGDTDLLDVRPAGVPLEIRHTGQGGELARAFYGTAGSRDERELAKSLYTSLVYRWPPPILSKEGEQLVDAYLRTWVGDQLGRGAPASSIPDLFYLLERMANWAGPTHGVFEYGADTTSPLWNPRLLRHQFALSPDERARELFHFHLLEELDPRFSRVPFDGSSPPWPVFGEARRRRTRKVQRVVRRGGSELRRRYDAFAERRGRRRTADETIPDPLVGGISDLRDAVAGSPTHDAWEILHKRRVHRLLGRDPRALDPRSRRYVWRLATIFLADT